MKRRLLFSLILLATRTRSLWLPNKRTRASPRCVTAKRAISAVPEGKGVSSSAALEVATMQALAAAYELNIAAEDLALLCQKVENLVVGAPCGVMDQMSVTCAEANRLLELLCQRRI